MYRLMWMILALALLATESRAQVGQQGQQTPAGQAGQQPQHPTGGNTAGQPDTAAPSGRVDAAHTYPRPSSFASPTGVPS